MEDTKTATVHEPELKHHFDDMGQQHEAATLGMWLFLATEVLFFGGLFAAYMLYRVLVPEHVRRRPAARWTSPSARSTRWC